MVFLQRYKNLFSTLPSFGLDISDKSIKFVWLKGRDLSLADFGDAVVPSGLVVSGEVKDQAKLSDLLRGVLKKRRLPKFVVISLPEEKGFMQTMQLPLMEKEELHDAIRWEIEGNVPLAPKDAVFDFEVLTTNEKNDRLNVGVAVFPSLVVDAYVRVCEAAGFIPAALELESQAIARSVVPWRKGGSDPMVICDIGAMRTAITIIAGSAILFTASRPIAGASFTDEISRVLKIDWATAEEKKRYIGLSNSPDGKMIFETLQPSLRMLAKEIRDAAEFYQSHATRVHNLPPHITKVILCGGEANLPGLSNFLSRELGMLTERANPWVNIFSEEASRIPQLSFRESLAYTTALGLALRGASFPLFS